MTITRKKRIRHISVDLSMSAWKNVGAKERANVNVHIRAGEVVAFVGVSGPGKSALLNLVLGFYPPMKGEIFIDGISLSEEDKRISAIMCPFSPGFHSLFRNALG